MILDKTHCDVTWNVCGKQTASDTQGNVKTIKWKLSEFHFILNVRKIFWYIFEIHRQISICNRFVLMTDRIWRLKLWRINGTILNCIKIPSSSRVMLLRQSKFWKSMALMKIRKPLEFFFPTFWHSYSIIVQNTSHDDDSSNSTYNTYLNSVKIYNTWKIFIIIIFFHIFPTFNITKSLSLH